jgi:hypothetical protein
VTLCLRVNSTFKGSRDTRRKISSCHFKVKNRANITASNLKSLRGEILAGSAVSKRKDLTRAAFRLPPSAFRLQRIGTWAKLAAEIRWTRFHSDSLKSPETLENDQSKRNPKK